MSPGRLEAVSYAGGVEDGRDMLQTAGETSELAVHADHIAVGEDGDELCFLTIRAMDQNGVPVFDEAGEVAVKVSGGALLALGAADPKPNRTQLFTNGSCPMFEGTAMAVLRGGPGCAAEVTLRDVTAKLSVPFAQAAERSGPVHDVRPGPLDLPLGELMEDPAALAVLKTCLATMMDNPMVSAMKDMSLKKIFAISGQPAPEGLEDALAQVKDGGTDHV